MVIWKARSNSLAVLLGGMFLLALWGCSEVSEEGLRIEWQNYDPALLDQAREAGRPVMISFHADWCVPCVELEKYTLSDERVVEATRPFLPLLVDWTEFESSDGFLPGAAGELQRRFLVQGLPTVLFLDSTGEEVRESRVFGYMDPEDFVSRAELAAGSG